MSFYLRTEEIDNNKPVFFFDIDQTFGASTHMFFKNTQDNYDEVLEKLEDAGISMRFAYDTMHLSKSCLVFFAELLKATGGVAICISSWSSSSNPEKTLKAIEHIFSWYADFPDNWLIGNTSGTGADRYEYDVKPMIERLNILRPLVIDDGYHQYANKTLCVKVDGRIGFNIYNLVEAVEMLNINSGEFPDEVAHHIRQILKEKA